MDLSLSYCHFSVCHYTASPSIYSFWFLLWYRHTFPTQNTFGFYIIRYFATVFRIVLLLCLFIILFLNVCFICLDFSFQIMIKCSNVPSNCNIFITISSYIRLRFEKQFYSEICKVKNCLFNQYLNLYNQKNRKIWWTSSMAYPANNCEVFIAAIM
jgi:hypothetical protein